MPRGGPRTGRPGGQYPNRSDLRSSTPAATGPSQQYGQRIALERAQQALPAAAPPAPPPPPAGQAAPAANPPAPGSFGPLDSPSARPNEPVTAGVDVGPGPGSEVLRTPAQPDGIDPDLAQMARHLPMLELMASEPSSTVAFRNYVRRLRGIVPTEQ